MSEAGGGPLSRIADVFFYLPIGLAARAVEEVPKLAAAGRERFQRQAPLARMVGQMAVAQGRRRVEGLVDRRSDQPGDAGPGVVVPIRDLRDEDESSADASAGPAPDAADLPIPGYDSLSASQVVQRLPGLSADELEAVRAYEQAGRGRKTVLLRVAQLRSSG